MSMIADGVRSLLQHDPFEPFRLVLTSGKHHDIVDPSLTVALKSQVFVAFPDGEHWALVPFLHIASIESIAGNQRRRRRRA